MATQTEFRETQHFSLWLTLPVLLISLAVPVPAVVGTRGNLPAHAWLALLIAPVVCFAVVFVLRLVTEVREDGVYVALRPLPFRRVAFADIKTAGVRTYRPLLEYGGWGIRFGWKGMAYNARGSRGVQLELQDGRRVLIGSQRPEDLLRAITERTGPAHPQGVPA